jgi:phosphoglycerate dehydrogenase-like enzyme/predicted dehydrogenase
MIRVLVVGCGKIGMAGHLPALKVLQDEGLVEVTACDADRAKADAAASQFGVAAATDWEAAADEADAVAVCLPPGPNAEVSAEAVGRGLHVLCEKPPGRTLEQAEAMAAAAAGRPGAVTMVGFNRRHNPLYLRALAQSRALGAPTSFYGRFSQVGLGNPPDDTVTDWIVSSSSHALDLAVATMGYPTAVTVSRRALGGGPDNAWSIHLHTDRGAALLLLHYGAGRRAERFEWAGPGYDVVLDLPQQAEWAQAGRKPQTWLVEDKAYHLAFGFLEEYRAFLRAITGDGPRPEHDFAYAPVYMRLVDTILATPDGGRSDVPPFQPAAHAPAPASKPAPPTAVPRGGSPERPVVLIHQAFATAARFFPVEGMAALEARCDVRRFDGPSPDAAWKEAQVLVTGRGAKQLPADVAQLAPNLELLVVLGASVRNYAKPALLERGVAVCNTADAVARTVAEHCLMVSLAGLRRLTQADRSMHEGKWPRPGEGGSGRRDVRAMVRELPLPPNVRQTLARLEREARARLGQGPRVSTGGPAPPAAASDLRRQIVGLVGWGHTARRFAELLRPFECTILVASDAAPDEELDAAGVRRASLGEVLAAATVVSLHKGLTDRTKGFLGERELALLRAGSVLVNAARGPLVDEAALLARLRLGDIVAALDVFNEEPLPPKHPLRKLDNVILTPHHASTTAQEERNMGEEALATVLAWADGKPVPTLDTARMGNMS